MKRFGIVLGLLLFLLGVLAIIHPSFDYQKHEEIARIGPIKATVDKTETEKIPVGATITLLVAGLILIAVSAKAK